MNGDGFVYVIDDDDAVRDSLVALLASAGLAVRSYAAAEAFLDALDHLSGGCVVTDVQMPGMTGLQLLDRLKGRTGEFPVIVLTGQADVRMAVEALKNGASDFIEKPFESDALLAAVQRALAHRSQSQSQATLLAESAQRIAGLSARERDVLGGLVAGHSNKEIARGLNISPRTVETYRANIMTKTRAGSLSELVRITLLTGHGT
jgi:two-component system response regulator FixJ